MCDRKRCRCWVGGVRWMGCWRDRFVREGALWCVVIEMCVCVGTWLVRRVVGVMC